MALVGANGSGKSTVVNLLLRFWDTDEGMIRIGGRELHTIRADDVRGLLGVVPQHTHLFNASIRDNLYLANPEASEADLVAACQQAQLHEFIQSLPQGYDTLVGENGLLLSGGERQRLAIARAILKDAPILILDEATSHLDALTAARIWQALDSFMAGRTTIIISHQRATPRACRSDDQPGRSASRLPNSLTPTIPLMTRGDFLLWSMQRPSTNGVTNKRISPATIRGFVYSRRYSLMAALD